MSFTGTLFGFQQPALKMMLDRERLLLALEMGLGKTVVTIAAIEQLLDEGEVGTGLIICATSLKYQWARMIDQYTTDATVLVIDGPPPRRQQQYSEALTGDYDYVILNFEQVVNDWDFVSKIPSDYVVVDEATAIKNFRAKRTRKIKRLKCRYRFALTGQPIENRPEEVYSILQWVDSNVLGRFDLFDRAYIVRNKYGAPKYYRNLRTLHHKLEGVMVRKRRDDEDVRDQLPRVVEKSRLIDFDPAGARLYRKVAADLSNELAAAMNIIGSFDVLAHYSSNPNDQNAAELAARGRIMSRLLALRMLCDHPSMLTISADQYRLGTGTGSSYADDLKNAGLLASLTKAPKLDACKELLEEILDAEACNKVVVFSFFKETLGILHRTMPYGSVLFTGDMTAREKDTARQTFQTDPACRLFLSSDAGGYGVDLPQANYLLNYDLPWSAGKLDQRNARIVRLSSTWESVLVVNLLMRGSIEERMYALLSQKRAVASAVVDGRGIDGKGQLQLDLASLTEFLQGGGV